MSQQSIKVMVRIRPQLQKQKTKKLSQYLSYDLQQKCIVIDCSNQSRKKKKIFTFDDVCTANVQQLEMFQKTGKILVNDVLSGYNGTIFAYGQTGSGKTYTMMGNTRNHSQKGIIPRCFESILTGARQNANKDYLIMFSFIQIYNEQIYDLLTSHSNKQKLQLRQSPDIGLFIKDVKKLAITSEQQMSKYIKIGTQNRITAQTLFNTQSSRSHSIFTIYVESLQKQNQGKQKVIGSKFNLVDLAGSERQSKINSYYGDSLYGQRFIQTTKINLSLTALGKVITCLVQGKGVFIPYRDSKLTRLLQDSLGGNSKTIMIATISPLSTSIQQTISTLKYASKAKYITNIPIINTDPKDTLILEYQKQIKELRIKLQSLQQYPQINQLKQEKLILTKIAQEQKNVLVNKIMMLQQKLISPNQMSEKLIKQKYKRQKKLSFMEKNYIHLEQQVKEMRQLITDLRRKYKNASKQIIHLQSQYLQQRSQLQQQNSKLQQQNTIYKTITNILFTPKQLTHLINLGTWQDNQSFTLPKFYFKDRNTLAFPCDEDDEIIKQKQNYIKRSISKSKTNNTIKSMKSVKSINKNYYQPKI